MNVRKELYLMVTRSQEVLSRIIEAVSDARPFM
jgi:hypothetical protein